MADAKAVVTGFSGSSVHPNSIIHCHLQGATNTSLQNTQTVLNSET